MRILIAPDKFKGSLTAAEVASAIAAGIPAGHEVTLLPLADGGDGSVDAAVSAGFERRGLAAFDGSALVVEVANSCGIALLGDHLDPLGSSTAGLGTALVGALDGLRDRAPRRIVVAAGGSASTDGGMGLLAALGIRFLDAAGHELTPSGAELCAIVRVDTSGLRDLSGIELLCATDVDNPLTGQRGAAAVFAPQKGADATQVAGLESGLHNLVRRLGEAGLSVAERAASTPGAGAAGGTGFAILVLGGSVVSGADFFLDLLRFDEAAAQSDLVITGEGRLDDQTASGKLVAVVARRAGGAPVVAAVGHSLLGEPQARTLGLSRVLALSDYSDADSSRDQALSIRLLGEIGRDAVVS